jgi:hypothetical protein
MHSTELRHIQATHEKMVFQIKEMHRQKEQRLQERIDLLSQTPGDRDLNIVRDLQLTLDKIRSITKPIYDQKVRDFPDFEPLKSERLEVMYTDFVVFLARQASSLMRKLEDIDYEPEPSIHDEEELCKQPYVSFNKERSNNYPSVTNLLSHQNEEIQFKTSDDNQPSPDYKMMRENHIELIEDSDLQNALRIQQEFERQHNLLLKDLSPGKNENKENHRINSRTVSVPNFVPCNLSQRDFSRKSLHTDIKETIHSERNKVFQDKGHYVTLSQDNSLDRLTESQSPFIASQNIKSLQMSAKITPRSSSNFKSKFGHLFHKKKI